MKNMRGYVNTDKVTRLEIIDHRPCKVCDGSGFIVAIDPTHMEEPEQRQCSVCYGLGIPGRTVVARSGDVVISVDLQDEDRTLKVFISERSEDERKNNSR